MFLLVIAFTFIVGCSSGSKGNSTKSNSSVQTNTPTYQVVSDVDALQLKISETEHAYQDFWLVDNNKGNGNNRTGTEIIDQLDFLFDFVRNNNGKLNICIEFDFKKEKVVTADKIEAIRETIQNGVNTWKEGLNGYNGWAFNEDIPVTVSAISKSSKTTINAHDDLLTGRSVCNKSDGDFKVKFSDYNIGSRGFGGNWGMQMRWYVFNSELASGVFHITYHELGHVMGLPDVYSYPKQLDHTHHLDEVKSIMANNDYKEVQQMDHSMLRKVWNLSN